MRRQGWAALVAVLVLGVSACGSEPETDAARCQQLSALAAALPATPSDQDVQQFATDVERIAGGLTDTVARIQWTGATVGAAEDVANTVTTIRSAALLDMVRSANLGRLDRAIKAGIRECDT